MTNPAVVKKRLQRMLDSLSLPTKITASDIEDIIWNESNSTDFNRLIGMLIENENDVKRVNQIMEMVQEAWNKFPHKILEGKSPEQLVEEYSGTITNGSRQPSQSKPGKDRKTMSDVFAASYPDKTQFIKISLHDWGFKFTKLYHELNEQYHELTESDIDSKRYENTLVSMLQQVPELFDVANELAIIYGHKNNFKAAKNIYETALNLAKSYIPPEFNQDKDHIIWAYLDNRPFLRLLAGYAEFIYATKSINKAIPLYEEIQSFNPNDNQGIRYMLATAYLKTNRPESVIELASHYPEEIGPDLVMGNVLALFKLGNVSKAKAYLKKNKKYQLHVIKELLKHDHPQPEDLEPDRVIVGGEDEAWYYWQDQGSLWQATPGAIDILKNSVDHRK